MKSIIRNLNLTIIILFIALATQARVYETIKNGDWDSKSSWKDDKKPGTYISSSNSIKISHQINLDKNVTIDCGLTFYSGGSLSGNKNFSVNSSGSLFGSNTSVNISVVDFNFYSSTTLSNATFNINCSDDFSCSGNFTLSSNAVLNVSANDDIYFYNSTNINSGTINLIASDRIAFSGNLIVKGNMELNAPYYFFYNNLEVNNGGYLTILNSSTTATASNAVDIINGTLENHSYFKTYSSLELSTNGTLITYGTVEIVNKFTNNGTVTIESTNYQTGNIIYSSKAGSSNLTVKRHLTSGGWHYVSSPVNNSSSNVFHSAALYQYDETQGSWDAIGANETLTNMKGYDAYYKSQNKTIVFHGQMNDGNISINVTKTTGSTSNGFNLVGNPYPSAIDWNASSGWTKTNIDNAVYVWDDATQSITTYVNSVGTNGGSNIIPATMAFFVKCNNTNGGSLTVKNAARIPDHPKFREESTNNTFKIKIAGNSYSDETAVNFNENATAVYDAQFDAEKMYSYNPIVPQIFTLSDDLKEFAINSIPAPSINSTIPLHVFCPVNGEYSLSFDAGEFDQTYDVFIEDKKTGNVFDTKTGTYSFNAENTENKDRFLIHFVAVQEINNTTYSAIETDAEKSEMKAWVSNNVLYLNSETASEKEVNVYDLQGKNLFQTISKDSKISLSLTSGVYIFKISENGETYTTKSIIK